MNKTKFLKNALLSATLTSLCTFGIADTLTYKITGPSSMTAHWVWTASCGGDLGIMTLVHSDGITACESLGGIECQHFELFGMLYSDWKSVYNATIDWSIYNTVKQAGGEKVYNLSTIDCSNKGKLAESMKKLISGSVNGGMQTIQMKAK